MTTTLRITPNGDFVLLEMLPFNERITGSGIVVPVKARDNHRDARTAKVLAVGPGRNTDYGSFSAVDVKVGDLVLIPRSGGIAVEHEKLELRMIRCAEILGTVEESRIELLQ